MKHTLPKGRHVAVYDPFALHSATPRGAHLAEQPGTFVFFSPQDKKIALAEDRHLADLKKVEDRLALEQIK